MGPQARRTAGAGAHVDPAIKAVGLGSGPAVAVLPGSRVHDEIVPDADRRPHRQLARPTNNAGGLEGGVTNGEDVRVTAWMKPISTLMKPLRSVDLSTMAEAAATIERSDVCAVPAAAVVGEAMVAWFWPTRCSKNSAATRRSRLTKPGNGIGRAAARARSQAATPA